MRKSKACLEAIKELQSDWERRRSNIAHKDYHEQYTLHKEDCLELRKVIKHQPYKALADVFIFDSEHNEKEFEEKIERDGT